MEVSMKKFVRWIVLFTLISTLLLSACGTATPVSPTPTPAPVIEAPATTYPEPAGAYPAPAPVVVEVANPYPGPGQEQGNYAEWPQAEETILSGQVARFFQASSKHVTLVLKDGSILLALEPAIDEVIRVIERCGEACKDIEQANP
jgi:hypothetical protein